jgi:uncharacterized protein (DUF1800 family)
VGTFTDSRHDHTNKTLFAGTGHQYGPADLGVVDAAGVLLPPATNMIDALFQHEDSDGELTMPRYLAKKLWEYFAYPNPSKTLVGEITATFVANRRAIRRDSSSAISAARLHATVPQRAGEDLDGEDVRFAIRDPPSREDERQILPDHLEAMGMDLFDPPGVNGWPQGLPWVSAASSSRA